MIVRHEITRLEIPTGRVIGDCACHYDTMSCVALALTDRDGLTGWGFGIAVAKGVYTRSAPWRHALPSEAELRAEFAAHYWPWVEQTSPEIVLNRARVRAAEYSPLNHALELALWDLQARGRKLPLHLLLGGDGTRDRIRAYGSGLDFQLDDTALVAAHRRYVERGYSAVKVKAGHSDAQRDLTRLMKVRDALGPEVEISIDANEGWTCAEAIDRITLFEKHGVQLAYVEDPLPLADVDGFAKLAQAVPVDIAGHDYATSVESLRRLLDVGGLRRLRVHGTLNDALACGALAQQYDVSLIVGNSIFEYLVHAAAALPSVERIEFSDLAWNRLVASPVTFSGGFADVPMRPGLGLEPTAEALTRYRKIED